MQPAESSKRLSSARTVRNIGVVLGMVIGLGLLIVLVLDRNARIESARRQSLALATGVDRLLHYELRNLERAMSGIATDAEAYAGTVPQEAHRLLSDAIDGVVSRHAELESIGLYDSRGAPLTRISPDPALPAWSANAERSVPPQRLRFGKLERAETTGWVLPIALETTNGGWLVARLRSSELQNMVSQLDTGREGAVAVTDRGGVVLADSRGQGGFVGRQVPLPSTLVADGTASLPLTSRLDGVERMSSFSEGSGYPLLVAAGIGMREILLPWQRFAATAAILLALYWLGLLYLVRRMRAAEWLREKMVEALEEQADWLRQAQLAAGSGVWRMDPADDQVHTSAQAAELFGFPAVAGDVSLDSCFDRMHQDDRQRVAEEFSAARECDSGFHSEYRIVLPTGDERWMSARGALVGDKRGQARLTGTVVDITERRDEQRRLERAELQFRELFERNPLAFWVFDVATLRFLAVNATALRNYGYTRDEFMAMTILELCPSSEIEALRASLHGSDEDSDRERVWTHQTRDGRLLAVNVHSSTIQFNGRKARLVLGQDVSERVAYERDLAWRANHDATTGLLTLTALSERLDAMPRAAAGGDYVIAYVQLRDLELVAPTLGRLAGEATLREAAQRFGRVGTSFGYAAYVPGESFVIAALDGSRGDALTASLIDAIAEPVQSEGGSTPLEAWIGIAQGPRGAETAENVIGHAALAAVHARREHVRTMDYDASMSEQASLRMALVGRLSNALARNEFELFYQPIRRIADGRVVALEALLRWRQAQGGYIPPMQFIPLCEESGLIVPIGEWVLEEAARAHGVLAQHGMADLSIAVNVSAVQFLPGSLPGSLRALRKRYALPRGALHVELTESVVLRRPDLATALMDELQRDGVCISIDDFGTGFSSMAYLRDLPLDCLKVDRTFVHNVDHDERNASICRALISLGHGLGLNIIAEGVETAAQLEWLRAHGCDEAQGYHLGRPAPVDELLASVREPG